MAPNKKKSTPRTPSPAKKAAVGGKGHLKDTIELSPSLVPALNVMNATRRSSKWYHLECAPEELKQKFESLDEEQFEKATKEKKEQKALFHERRELKKDLKALRTHFADRLDVSEEPYKVYQDKTIDELVIHLPTNMQDLMKIWGMKEKRCQSFGAPILSLIRKFKKKQADDGNNTDDGSNEEKAGDNDDGDNEIAMGESLKCEELVERKFQHAEQNNYVISID